VEEFENAFSFNPMQLKRIGANIFLVSNVKSVLGAMEL